MEPQENPIENVPSEHSSNKVLSSILILILGFVLGFSIAYMVLGNSSPEEEQSIVAEEEVAAADNDEASDSDQKTGGEWVEYEIGAISFDAPIGWEWSIQDEIPDDGIEVLSLVSPRSQEFFDSSESKEYLSEKDLYVGTCRALDFAGCVENIPGLLFSREQLDETNIFYTEDYVDYKIDGVGNSIRSIRRIDGGTAYEFDSCTGFPSCTRLITFSTTGGLVFIGFPQHEFVGYTADQQKLIESIRTYP